MKINNQELEVTVDNAISGLTSAISEVLTEIETVNENPNHREYLEVITKDIIKHSTYDFEENKGIFTCECELISSIHSILGDSLASIIKNQDSVMLETKIELLKAIEHLSQAYDLLENI